MNAIHPSSSAGRVAEFILAPNPNIPESALEMAALLLLDTVGVAAGAVHLDVAHITRDFALDFYSTNNPEMSARLMFDGRTASMAGAAFAAATQIDNLDAHDGYNPTRGHIGCAVVPALLAFSHQHPELSGRDALAALVIAYEVAARAGISLHATASDYHTSGAWNALGVVALGCRLSGYDSEVLRQAMGIAEYHGPRSQMMREIANPTMLHDGSGMGAFVGVSATIMAARGFQGAPAITVEAEEVEPFWRNLGEEWTIEKNYIKPYPICRWAHAAIDAVYALMQAHDFAADDVARVDVRTFHEAAQLFAGMPQTTSQAQYSLPFAVAVMLQFGSIGPEYVTGKGLRDPSVGELVKRIHFVEDERHSKRFPAARWSDVTLKLTDGRIFESGDIHARGGPEAPMGDKEIRAKFDAMTLPVLGSERSSNIWNEGQKLLKSNGSFKQFAELIYPGAVG